MGDKKVAPPSRTMTGLNIRLLDQIIIGLGFLLLVAIGIHCSRRSQTDEGYFLAGRSMPGWVVGFSLMATIVSSLTFLGLPAFAFGDANWRNVLSLFTYIPAVFVAVYLFIPFYRATRVRSAYEYLELRFGTLGPDLCGRRLRALPLLSGPDWCSTPSPWRSGPSWGRTRNHCP